MRSVLISSAGAAPQLGEFPEPAAGPKEQRVSLVAAGLHPAVRSLPSGDLDSGPGPWPRIPGIDAVARAADGRLIYVGFVKAPYGTFAEVMSVPFAVPLTEGIDDAVAAQVAAAVHPGLSSWLPLRREVRHGRLGSVWVLGASGFAGALAVQNARELGAERIVVSGRRRRRLEQLDADVVVPFGQDLDQAAADFAAEATHTPPALVLDYAWGAVAEAVFAGLVRSAVEEDDAATRYVEIGQAAGAQAALPAGLLRSRAITLAGSGAGATAMDDLMLELPVYLERICRGRVHVPVVEFGLDEVGTAWTHDDGDVRPVLVP